MPDPTPLYAAAIDTLSASLDVSETNCSIAVFEGRTADAEKSAAEAADIRAALVVLRREQQIAKGV